MWTLPGGGLDFGEDPADAAPPRGARGDRATGTAGRPARGPLRRPRARRDHAAATGSTPSSIVYRVDDRGRRARARVRGLHRPRRLDPVRRAGRAAVRRRSSAWAPARRRAADVHSTIGIDIAAPPDLVYRLARDVTRWERLLPHYSRSGSSARAGRRRSICDFVARRPFVPVLGLGIPVTWRSRTWHEPATRRLRFVHVAGATKGMDVTWTIEPPAPTVAGTRVEIAHDFRPRVPGFAAFVDRGSPGRSPAGRWPRSRPRRGDRVRRRSRRPRP